MWVDDVTLPKQNARRHHVLEMTMVAVVLCVISARAQPVHSGVEEARAEREAHFRSFEYGRSYLRERRDVTYQALDFSTLPKVIKSQMYNRLAAVLQERARPQSQGRPYESGRMDIAVYAAKDARHDDLVEYTWMHMGQNLRIVASRNALRLEIDLAEIDRNSQLEEFGNTRLERVRGLIEHTLRLSGETFAFRPKPFEIQIPWPDSLDEGTQFSTNPKRNIMSMDSVRWHERVDFSVHNGTFSSLFFFKPGQLMGPQDGSKWFDEAFRTSVLKGS